MTWHSLAWRLWMIARTALRPIPSCPRCGMPLRRCAILGVYGRVRREWECVDDTCLASRTFYVGADVPYDTGVMRPSVPVFQLGRANPIAHLPLP